MIPLPSTVSHPILGSQLQQHYPSFLFLEITFIYPTVNPGRPPTQQLPASHLVVNSAFTLLASATPMHSTPTHHTQEIVGTLHEVGLQEQPTATLFLAFQGLQLNGGTLVYHSTSCSVCQVPSLIVTMHALRTRSFR